jgi:phage shock protein C
MYCTNCGTQLTDREIYCSQCGHATEKAAVQPRVGPMPRQLMRSATDKKIAGVCAGVAKYLEVDVTLVRLIWIILVFTPPPVGLIAYIVAWIVMPIDRPRLSAASGEPSRANGY